jgi:hypothetical protein
MLDLYAGAARPRHRRALIEPSAEQGRAAGLKICIRGRALPHRVKRSSAAASLFSSSAIRVAIGETTSSTILPIV